MGDFKPINQEFFENNVSGVEVSKNGSIKSKDKIRKPYETRGYQYVNIRGNKFAVHRLVLATHGATKLNQKFKEVGDENLTKPDFFSYLDVHHKNSNQEDNNITNLEALTDDEHKRFGMDEKEYDNNIEKW